jgi:hypothetical protein
MEAKEFYKSKTFWINVIAFAIALLSAFGLVGPALCNQAGYQVKLTPLTGIAQPMSPPSPSILLQRGLCILVGGLVSGLCQASLIHASPILHYDRLK